MQVPFNPPTQVPFNPPTQVQFNPPTQVPFLTTGGVAGFTKSSTEYLALQQTQAMLLLEQRQLIWQFLELRQHDPPWLAPSDKSVPNLEEQPKKDGAGSGGPHT